MVFARLKYVSFRRFEYPVIIWLGWSGRGWQGSLAPLDSRTLIINKFVIAPRWNFSLGRLDTLVTLTTVEEHHLGRLDRPSIHHGRRFE